MRNNKVFCKDFLRPFCWKTKNKQMGRHFKKYCCRNDQWCLKIPRGWNVALCRLSERNIIILLQSYSWILRSLVSRNLNDKLIRRKILHLCTMKSPFYLFIKLIISGCWFYQPLPWFTCPWDGPLRLGCGSIETSPSGSASITFFKVLPVDS